MKPAEWQPIWRSIYAHERVWSSVGARTMSPEGKAVLRQFFAFWDPIYMAAMDIQDEMSRGVYVLPDRFRSILRGLWEARERAMRIGLGLDRASGKFYPKIDPKTLTSIKFHGWGEISPVPRSNIRASGEDMSKIPASFRATLTGEISSDHILTMQGCYDGRCYTAKIDLKPIAARVKEMIRRYHVSVLHGDMSKETIAGLGDWFRNSVKTASRIANAKAAAKLWKAVEKHHGKIEAGLSMLGPYGQGAALTLRTGFTVKTMLTKAKAGDPEAVADVKSIVALAKEGDPSAEQVTKIMKAMNEMGKAKDEKIAESVNGWLWNRPYRENAPSFRGLYNLGLMAS